MSRTKHLYLRLAVDLVIFTIRDDALQVLVIERGIPPYEGELSLPGGFLREGEDLAQAALRELGEETSLDGEPLHLEQLATYGAPDRDPRGRIVSVAYVAIAPQLPVPVAGADARRAWWRPVDAVRGKLAFDHDQILDDALERVRAKLEYSDLATAFCAEPFTIGELRRVYEVVWGVALDPRNFSRKVLATDGLIVPTGELRRQETGRPASLYRRGSTRVLYPPMLRTRSASS
jgi:8-oxo-dGTP diphosphatase